MCRHFRLLTIILVVGVLLFSASATKRADRKRRTRSPLLKRYGRTKRKLHRPTKVHRKLNEKLGSTSGSVDAETPNFSEEIKTEPSVTIPPRKVYNAGLSEDVKHADQKRSSESPLVRLHQWAGQQLYRLTGDGLFLPTSDRRYQWVGDIISIQRQLNVKLGSINGAPNTETLKFLKEEKVKQIVVIQPRDMGDEAFNEGVKQLKKVFKRVVSRPQAYTGDFYVKRLGMFFPSSKKTLVIGSDVYQLYEAFNNRYLVALSDMDFQQFGLRKLN